ncbi:MAG TPA: LPS export ABC transporter permease LptF, partial [Burkholderiaceae bacterium]|nr:LPS export ABC transporter permease LptF [Burkholderiaceae bacterium]
MIFQRALRRELFSTAGAVFTVLFTITITNVLIRILGQAAGGKIASADVVAMIGFAVLGYMPILLQVTGFISVLWVLARSYQDSEMVVWFSAGLSLSRWIRPVLVFGIPIVILTGLLSFFVSPWASRQNAEFKERFEKSEDVATVQPGKFHENATIDRIYSVDENPVDPSKVRNVFVNTNQNGKTSVIVSKEGTEETDANGDKFLVLTKGRRYDGVANQADFELMEFERYKIFMTHQEPSLMEAQSAESLPTELLLANLNAFNLSELLWRIALPVMSFTLLLLAIPLSFVNPRGGRSANVIFALLLWITYENLVKVVQEMTKQGRLPFMFAWWPVHVFVLILVIFLFSWRLKMNSVYHPLAMWAWVKRACLKRRV